MNYTDEILYVGTGLAIILISIPIMKVINNLLDYDTIRKPKKRDWYMKRKKKDEKPTCLGCKHLGYWNSGEPFCTKGIDKACISNGFKFREEASK